MPRFLPRTDERHHINKEKEMGSLASALKLENVVYDKKGPIAYVTLNRPIQHVLMDRAARRCSSHKAI